MHLTTTLAPWSSHDTQLILSCVLGLALIIVFISVLKLAPFLSILVGTFAARWPELAPPVEASPVHYLASLLRDFQRRQRQGY